MIVVVPYLDQSPLASSGMSTVSASSKAFSCGASHDHGLVFCKRLYRGASVLAKFGKNLL